MKRRLFLSGEIGCGKSTLIKHALGERAEQAGGFVTLRVREEDVLKGFELAPAAILADGPKCYERRCFLSFSEEMKKEDSVFSEYAVELLKEAQNYSFAVLDEIGGVELLEERFWEHLMLFFHSDIPCIGVLKTETAVHKLCSRIPLGEQYAARYKALCEWFRKDEDSELWHTTGRYDTETERKLRQWTELYTKGDRSYVGLV